MGFNSEFKGLNSRNKIYLCNGDIQITRVPQVHV